MTIKLETYGGDHIRAVIRRAVEMARHDAVEFEFNGVTFTVNPGETYEAAKARAEEIFGYPILSADDEQAAAKADLERVTKESADAIAAAAVPTEKQLREADVPWPKTPDELSAYIATLVDRPHDYGTCVYAMSMAAVAAYQYVAHQLGTTGFQASCADLDFLKRTRGIKGPFGLMKAEDALYPQYNLPAKLEEWLREWRPWLKEEAAKKLAEPNDMTHPDVKRHWQELATK